jgi:hypothetical protein
MPESIKRNQSICFGCLREIPLTSPARSARASAFCHACRVAAGDLQIVPSASPIQPLNRPQPDPSPQTQELITLALISALGFWKDA